MPCRNPIPEDALRFWLSNLAAGREPVELYPAIRDKWPDRFGGLLDGTIWVAFKRELTRQAIDPHDIPSACKTFPTELPETWFDFEPNLLMFGDQHAPLHDERGLNLVCQTIQAREIKTAVLGGDLIDNAHKGYKGYRSVRAAHYTEGLHAGAKIIDALAVAGIERIVNVPGNHDDKPLRDTDQELTLSKWFDATIRPLMKADVEIIGCNRYYAMMRPQRPAMGWPLTSENFPWRFTHQKNYGQIQLMVARKIAETKLCNTATFHQHHLAEGWHKSNILRVVDCGCGQSKRLAEYKGIRDSTYPEWNGGFVTLECGVPGLWSFNNPIEWWEKQWR